MITTDLEQKTCDTLAEVAHTAPRSLLQKYDKIKLELAGLIRESIVPAEVDEQLREEGTDLWQAGETALASDQAETEDSRRLAYVVLQSGYVVWTDFEL